MINEVGNTIALYDLTRPFVWKYKAVGAVNLIYVIQKLNTFGIYEDISGELRQPEEFGSGGDFFINPTEILADEIDTQIRGKNESSPRVEFSGAIQFRLLITEEKVMGNGTLQYINNRNNWFTSSHSYGIDAATQHEETYGKNQANWLDNYRITIANGSANRALFLTNKPKYDTRLAEDDNEYIYTFINVKRTHLRISIETESTSLYTFTTADMLHGLNSIGIGIPNIINAIGQSDWNNISAEAVRVRYVVEAFNGEEISEYGYYIISKQKCNTERLRVYWKNRKGGVDGYTFNSELAVSTTVNSKLSKRPLGHRRVNSENINEMGYLVNNTYGSETRTIASTQIKAKETINVVSQFHTQEHLRWLSEITTSPQVWIENLQTGNLNAVYSITKKMDTKPKGKSLGQMKLGLVMSNEILTQR